MDLKSLINQLNLKQGYLKSGVTVIAKTFKVDEETAREALKLAKLVNKDNVNINDNLTDYEEFLIKNNINNSDVKSVKYWQTMGGEQRFSVVTKNNDFSIEELKKEIEDFARGYSPSVFKQSYISKNESDLVAYEISLPDIHYGKLTELSIEAMEYQFMATVQSLVDKAKGLNIEKFILPIGNDGMNSEGMRLATTKGTPQHDSTGWRESFRGYCKLMMAAIDFLKRKAPVHVVVVQGNHDFERMFYAGDVIKGWYHNDKNVTVDNDISSRKYVEYGVNMLMYTHGDKEKPSDMPLIMATEQPEMFARCSIREVHCGHLHKEMVNEYRGIKVRFIPSICANDDWHRVMGYEALRTGQAFIWGKTKGLEGYLQTTL
jgi:hypothetical protein